MACAVMIGQKLAKSLANNQEIAFKIKNQRGYSMINHHAGAEIITRTSTIPNRGKKYQVITGEKPEQAA